VVAFSGASIANTVEVKKEVVVFNPCQDAAIIRYEAYINCVGGDEDWGYLNQLMGGC
jgi:hypothetical protein